MRTSRVDDDHVARYENIGRRRYAFTVVHRATDRELGSSFYQSPTAIGKVDDEIAAAARLLVLDLAKQRREKSEAFARGERVDGAPPPEHVPPVQRAQIASAEGLEVSAAMPVRIIRDAYNRASLEQDREKHALSVGRDVLIGATDEQILKIARGRATLEGSLRTGVRYKELP